MRIVTQNRNTSIEFDGSEIHTQYGSLIYHTNLSRGNLGKYESEERAMEVFDEMHMQWQADCMSVYYMPER